MIAGLTTLLGNFQKASKILTPIDASYQVSVHLAKWFQRRRSANQKQELPMAAMFVNESELNEQSL